MPRQQSASDRRRQGEKWRAIRNILIGLSIISLLAVFYVKTIMSQRDLDNVTLCPFEPVAVTVLLVDVTDPLSLPQRQDFVNQLEALIQQIPRYGKIVIAKVDPIADSLLVPIITRCNPGSSNDVSELNGNPGKLARMRHDQFVEPIRAAFDQLLVASGADRSPILESVQSINLTELQRGTSDGASRRLIVASDLLQNTGEISFYKRLPPADELINSPAFRRVRTDLRQTDVELWMLQRNDSSSTQPRALPDLWGEIIESQGGRLMRVYTVSG